MPHSRPATDPPRTGRRDGPNAWVVVVARARPQDSPTVEVGGPQLAWILLSMRNRRWAKATTWLANLPRRTMLLNVVKGMFAVAAIVGSILGTASFWWIILAAFAAAASVAIDALQQKLARDSEVDLYVGYREVVHGALAPLSDYLGQLTTEPLKAKRHELFGSFRDRVVSSALNLVDGSTRSAYYKLDREAGELVRRSPGPPDSPRMKFVAGDPDTAHLIALVEKGGYVYIPNVASSEISPSVGSEYQSVIAVAVTAGAAHYGLLTVDSPDSDAFERAHVDVMRALAGLLGAGIGALMRPSSGDLAGLRPL